MGQITESTILLAILAKFCFYHLSQSCPFIRRQIKSLTLHSNIFLQLDLLRWSPVQTYFPVTLFSPGQRLNSLLRTGTVLYLLLKIVNSHMCISLPQLQKDGLQLLYLNYVVPIGPFEFPQ